MKPFLGGGIISASKIPIEALYLQTKSIPIRFIIAIGRILYHHSILQKDESEMVLETFEAQKMQPLEGDYVKIVTKDCELIGLNMTEDEIQCMKNKD